MDLEAITKELTTDLNQLKFAPPVTHVYNPLEYAWKPYQQYLRSYGTQPREVVLIGMNPGPWGMAQTGVPFGEVELVRDWLKIEAPVGSPVPIHPKRPILGFACTRREVSGRRLWEWAQRTYRTPQKFFTRFFVANYCPLMFLDINGRNITPNQLKVGDRKPLTESCDRALVRTVEKLSPRYVIGVGKFAYERARSALAGRDLILGSITHPSPANPRANRGWEQAAVKELKAIGINP